MAAILAGQTPLVVILPTGGGKSLLFMASACLDDARVTIVVVLFCALVDDLLQRLSWTGIDCLEWTYSEINAASIVVVSADVAGDWRFLDYASLLVRQQHLRQVVINECHLAFTSSDYRPKLAYLKRLRSFYCLTVLFTATLPPVLEVDLSESLLVPLVQYIRAVMVRKNTHYAIYWCLLGQDMATTAVSLIWRQTERFWGQ
jgi:superfamily II DNA helicase RecQ